MCALWWPAGAALTCVLVFCKCLPTALHALPTLQRWPVVVHTVRAASSRQHLSVNCEVDHTGSRSDLANSQLCMALLSVSVLSCSCWLLSYSLLSSWGPGALAVTAARGASRGLGVYMQHASEAAALAYACLRCAGILGGFAFCPCAGRAQRQYRAGHLRSRRPECCKRGKGGRAGAAGLASLGHMCAPSLWDAPGACGWLGAYHLTPVLVRVQHTAMPASCGRGQRTAKAWRRRWPGDETSSRCGALRVHAYRFSATALTLQVVCCSWLSTSSKSRRRRSCSRCAASSAVLRVVLAAPARL